MCALSPIYARAQEMIVVFRRLTEDDFNFITKPQPPSQPAFPSAGKGPCNTAGAVGGGGPLEAGSIPYPHQKAKKIISWGRPCERPFAHALQDTRGYRELIADHARDVALRCRMSYWRRSAGRKLAFDNLAAQLSVGLRVKCQEFSNILEMQARMLPPSLVGEGGAGAGAGPRAGAGAGEEAGSGVDAGGDGGVSAGADKDLSRQILIYFFSS